MMDESGKIIELQDLIESVKKQVTVNIRKMRYSNAIFHGEKAMTLSKVRLNQCKLASLEAASKEIIHLSCHGYFNSQEPLNSGLLLSDGMLTVKDIFGMSMDTDLLALSACETGINKQKPGDELVGEC